MSENEEEDKCWICGRTAEDVAQALAKMGCSQKLLDDIKKMTEEGMYKEDAVTKDGLIMCVDSVYGYSFLMCAVCRGMLDILAYKNGYEAARDKIEDLKEYMEGHARLVFRKEVVM